MEFQVLGPVTVASGSESLKIGGPKQRTVMAMLIARAGQSVTADALATAVYGDEVPERSRRLIQTYVSTLRSVVGDAITKHGDGWSLVAGTGGIDAARVEELYESAAHLDRAKAAEVLREALSVWRGAPYADVEAHGELDAEITRLDELRLTILEARVDADLELGRHGDVIGELDALVAEHPYRERFRAQHMLALYRSGRQREALDSYRTMRELLVEELGVDPSPELQDLERRILDQDDSLSVDAERRAIHPPAIDPSNLPVLPTPIIGRVAEVARVRGLMEDHRLVTLIGVGGCGKTRLAIEVAHQMKPEFDDGVYFADFTTVSTDDDVAPAVADAMQLGLGGGEPVDRVVDYLADKHALVVLDNCEHVVDGAADLAAVALRRSGSWQLLATSRESLNVDGEQLYGVPPLRAEAVDLFATRARELDPDVAVDEANRPIIQELCERLDGMPLAIELAAARTSVLSPAELLAGIGDRFRLLSGGRRRAGDRRRTLEATLDWSYDLLTADEQHLFRCLGVFNGPFDAASAADVGQIEDVAALDLLESLVAKSLVTAESSAGGRELRLLATVRAFAERHLVAMGEFEAAHDRQLDHVLGLSPTDDAVEWLAMKPTLDAAIDWAIERQRWDDAVVLLTRGTPRWHYTSPSPSSADRLRRVAERVPTTSRMGEGLLATQVAFALATGQSSSALSLARRAAAARDEDVAHTGLWTTANLLTMTDPDEALRIADSLVANARARETGTSEAIRAYVHMYAGEYGKALAALRRDAGPSLIYEVTAAALLLIDGQPGRALETATGHPMAEWAWSSFEVIAGLSELELGRRAAATDRLVAEARSAASGRDPYAATSCLVGLAALLHERGDAEGASEAILSAPLQRLQAMNAVARAVADRIGVRAELVERQEATFLEDDRSDDTPLLRDVLARWDALT